MPQGLFKVTTTQVIAINNITIHQDKDGGFNLNDLHQAAGGLPHHQPGTLFFNEGTKALVAELNSPDSEISPVSSLRGRWGGTFVVKELAYASIKRLCEDSNNCFTITSILRGILFTMFLALD